MTEENYNNEDIANVPMRYLRNADSYEINQRGFWTDKDTTQKKPWVFCQEQTDIMQIGMETLILNSILNERPGSRDYKNCVLEMSWETPPKKTC